MIYLCQFTFRSLHARKEYGDLRQAQTTALVDGELSLEEAIMRAAKMITAEEVRPMRCIRITTEYLDTREIDEMKRLGFSEL